MTAALRAALVVAAATAAIAAATASAGSAGRSFVVANNTFLRDGVPVTLKSGEVHYHRIHPAYWADRLQRAAAMGLNAIQVVVPWNFHEVANGTWDFTGARDLPAFLGAAADAGLLVLLRPGPYICAEHDFGGFPYFLLNVPGMALRTNDTAYLAYVDRWWRVLLPVVAPYLYTAGGPVTSLQLENEYGSYGNTGGNPNDEAYMLHLQALAISLLGDGAALLYTTDGGSTGYMSHGALPGRVFATGDFGPTLDPGSAFAAEDAINPPGWHVHIDSEFYPGWLTHWGESMANISSLDAAAGLTAILAANASVSVYMVRAHLIVVTTVSACPHTSS